MTPSLLLPAPRRRRFLKTTAALAALPALASAARLHPATKATLYAHRGASALRPEHTLGSYAKAIADGALGRFDAVVLNALRETESALTVYARELDRNAALRAARDQSALAVRQSARRYQFGRTDFLSQLDAERTLASAESVLAASDAQLEADQVQLFLALGGGWENTHHGHGNEHDDAHGGEHGEAHAEAQHVDEHADAKAAQDEHGVQLRRAG